VATSASCSNATPYLNYTITVTGASVAGVTVHVLDRNGHEVGTLDNLAGAVLWPGWTRVDNQLTLDNAAVSTLSVYADLTVGTGGTITTGTVPVAFPAADTACMGVAPTTALAKPTDVTPSAPAQNFTATSLPVTGFPSETVAIAGGALVLLGLVLVARSRSGSNV
jgi:hypothetical protein